MRTLAILFFLGIEFFSIAYAENNRFETWVNRWGRSQACHDITEAQIQKIGLNCTSAQPTMFVRSAGAIFEDALFKRVAEVQIQKNKCMDEQITAMLTTEDGKYAWFNTVGLTWLMQKKAQLMARKCEVIRNKINPTEVRVRENTMFDEMFSDEQKENKKKSRTARYKSRDVYLIRLAKKQVFRAHEREPKIPEKLLDVCVNDDQVAALHAAEKVMPYSLPVINDQKILATMDQNRNLIINNKTKKPITDEEILAMEMNPEEAQKKNDQTNLADFSLEYTTDFERAISTNIENIQKERKSVTENIQKSKSFPNHWLSPDLKTYMFEDDTVFEVLTQTKDIPEDYKDIDSKGISNGAFCTLSRYEPSLKAEAAEMVASSVMFGVAAGIAVKAAQVAGPLKNVAMVKNLPVAGVAVGAGSTLPIFYDCADRFLSNKDHISKKVLATSKAQKKTEIKGAQLPPDIDFRRYDLKLDPKLTPSCAGNIQKNITLKALYNNSVAMCVMDAAPLQISIPVQVGAQLLGGE